MNLSSPGGDCLTFLVYYLELGTNILSNVYSILWRCFRFVLNFCTASKIIPCRASDRCHVFLRWFWNPNLWYDLQVPFTPQSFFSRPSLCHDVDMLSILHHLACNSKLKFDLLCPSRFCPIRVKLSFPTKMLTKMLRCDVACKIRRWCEVTVS